MHRFFGPVGAASFPTPTVESPSILEAPLCAMASSVQSAKQAFDKLLGALPTTLATVIIRAGTYHCLACYVGLKTLVYLEPNQQSHTRFRWLKFEVEHSNHYDHGESSLLAAAATIVCLDWSYSLLSAALGLTTASPATMD